MRAKSIFLRFILITLLLFPLSPATAATTAVPTISDIPNQTTNEDTPTSAIAFTVNDPPTVTDIADLSTPEDTSTAAIPFTIGDGITAVESLTVSKSSSNQALVPDANIAIGGSGASRTVTITPAANANGSAIITITVSDGILTTSDTFTLTVTAVNDLPTISAILNQTINEDSNTGALAIIVGDGETAAGSLTLSGSSSDQTLVPNGNIAFGGSDANRTVTVTPAANQSGTATITITVTDANSGTAISPFILTVTAVNDPPTIIDISNQTIAEGGILSALAFTVGDLETPAADLTLSSNSSNPALVPLINIGFGGSGASRTVTITPAAGQNGSSTITISVTDGNSSTTSDTFTLTVTAVDDPPTISDIGNQSTAENTSTGAIPFTVSDPDTNLDSLNLTKSSSNTTLVPNANVVLGGSGANRTVTITPALGQNGSTTITINVSDGTTTVSDTFTLTVTPVNDPPTISNITDKSTNEDSATSAIAFTVDDPDTALASLIITGSSSNTTVVPNTNFSFGGSGTDRTVTINPASNQNGTTTITISVNDGTTTVSDTFVLTVNAVNDLPTISDIDNQSTTVDTPINDIAFTVGDLETPAADLTLSSNSSNTVLVPLANITFGGSGANRTVNITPAEGQTGSATITITVTDADTGTASDTFTLTVNPGALQSIATPNALTLPIGDLETAALTLAGTSSNTTLVPNSNIVFGGSGANRTVTITPAANQHGTTTITITFSDGITPVSDTFTLTVNSVNDAPTGINLSNSTVAENLPSGTVVGTLSALDADLGIDPGETHTYSLVSGADGADNTAFEIAGNVLKTKAVFDAETKSNYSIRVRVTDLGGAFFEKAFIITVTSVNEAPTALDDPYTVRQGSTLTVPKTTGVLANDNDVDEPAAQKGYDYLTVGEIITSPQHADLFEMTQEADGKYRGAFVYRPEPHFAGVDTFTYKAVDSQGLPSLEATVQITVLDIESPLVSWTEPVTDGLTYDVVTGMLTLRVNAEDNVSIQRVRFLRWDALLNKHVEIGTDYEAPYEVELDANTLNWGWNQVFAEAYDNLGNRSNIPYIWLYRDKFSYYLPIISVPTR